MEAVSGARNKQKSTWFQMNRHHSVIFWSLSYRQWQLGVALLSLWSVPRASRTCLLWLGHGVAQVARCCFANVCFRQWREEACLPGGVLACLCCCALWQAEEGSRLAVDNIRLSQRKHKLFPLDHIIFYFTTDQSCYSRWQHSSYCWVFLHYIPGAWMGKCVPAIKCFCSFIYKCHLLWCWDHSVWGQSRAGESATGPF